MYVKILRLPAYGLSTFVKILQAVTPAFGRLAAIEARLEGDYRAGVGRVARESEEIAYVPISDAYIHVRPSGILPNTGSTMGVPSSATFSLALTCAS